MWYKVCTWVKGSCFQLKGNPGSRGQKGEPGSDAVGIFCIYILELTINFKCKHCYYFNRPCILLTSSLKNCKLLIGYSDGDNLKIYFKNDEFLGILYIIIILLN